MAHNNSDNLVAAFARPFIKELVPLESEGDVSKGVILVVAGIAKLVEGEDTPQTRGNAALAILTALMRNPYALLEAGWDGYAESGQDS